MNEDKIALGPYSKSLVDRVQADGVACELAQQHVSIRKIITQCEECIQHGHTWWECVDRIDAVIANACVAHAALKIKEGLLARMKRRWRERAMVRRLSKLEPRIAHPYHCPLDGTQLHEMALGFLECSKCRGQFLPFVDPDGMQCIGWRSTAKS